MKGSFLHVTYCYKETKIHLFQSKLNSLFTTTDTCIDIKLMNNTPKTNEKKLSSTGTQYTNDSDIPDEI